MKKKVIKHQINSPFVGELIYFTDGSLEVKKSNKVFSKETMQSIANDYKGANRIYKPIPLLFWTDCKNGNFKNWI